MTAFKVRPGSTYALKFFIVFSFAIRSSVWHWQHLKRGASSLPGSGQNSREFSGSWIHADSSPKALTLWWVCTDTARSQKESNQLSKHLSNFSKEKDDNRTLSTVLTLTIRGHLVHLLQGRALRCSHGKDKTLHRSGFLTAGAWLSGWITFFC